jgi:methylthioribulose-1-phosphate dehydratase
VLAGKGKPSAETNLHGVVYRDRPAVRAIFHVHSVWNTLLSDRYARQGEVLLENYELLKALSLVATHEHLEKVPVLENSQDYGALARELGVRLTQYPGAHGFLLQRHGLYVWGDSIAAAKRHLEAMEFLFEVEARRLRY